MRMLQDYCRKMNVLEGRINANASGNYISSKAERKVSLGMSVFKKSTQKADTASIVLLSANSLTERGLPSWPKARGGAFLLSTIVLCFHAGSGQKVLKSHRLYVRNANPPLYDWKL